MEPPVWYHHHSLSFPSISFLREIPIVQALRSTQPDPSQPNPIQFQLPVPPACVRRKAIYTLYPSLPNLSSHHHQSPLGVLLLLPPTEQPTTLH